METAIQIYTVVVCTLAAVMVILAFRSGRAQRYDLAAYNVSLAVALLVILILVKL